MIKFSRKNDKTNIVEELYRKYQKLMYYVAFNIVNNTVIAEDVVHEAIIKIIKHFDKIEDVEINSDKIKNLIITIVKHKSYDELKRLKRISYVSIDDEEPNLSDDGADIENLIISNDTINTIANALDEIDYKYSSVLKLRYFSELSFEEIAESLDIREDLARKRLERGRQILINQIKHYQKKGAI